MRTITDSAGARWDVLVGRESWGTHVLLFVPRDGGDARQVVLAAETTTAAEHELDGLSDGRLVEMLGEATVWGGE